MAFPKIMVDDPLVPEHQSICFIESYLGNQVPFFPGKLNGRFMCIGRDTLPVKLTKPS